MSNVNIGDVIATIIMLGIFVAIFLFIVFIYKAYKKSVVRAEERLNIEKQQAFDLQLRYNELNERVTKMEKLLKEVE